MQSRAQLGVVRGTSYRMRKLPIAEGDTGIRQTVKLMLRLIDGPEGTGSPLVRMAALDAVRGLGKRDEIHAVYQRVKSTIDFRGEADETLQSPQATLQMGAGDCDDHSSLLAAMLKSIGYQVEIKTIAVDRESPREFSHVYVVVKDKLTGQWIPLDTTVSRAFPGWEPHDITRAKMYPVAAVNRGMGRLRGPRLVRRHRGGILGALASRLGDDTTDSGAVQEDINSPVPIVAASTGDFSANQAFAYNLAAPFAQAAASVIAHGQTPSNSQIMAAQSQSMTTIWIMLGLGVVVVGMFALGGRR